MAANQLDPSADYIRHLFARLDEELGVASQRAVLYVVGGANISLAVDASRSTTDIDAVIKHGASAVAVRQFRRLRHRRRLSPRLGALRARARIRRNHPQPGL